MIILIQLWILFIIGQVLNTGNVNWQQDNNYIEINPLYGAHPTRFRVYVTKILETLIIFSVFLLLGFYSQFVLIVLANLVVWVVLYYDLKILEVPFKLRW